MLRCTRGEYGYINKKRNQQLLFALLMGVIAIAIYVGGYIASGYKRSDICLVLAILMALPGAKFLTTFIVLIPFRTPSKEAYDQCLTILKEKGIQSGEGKGQGELWSDYVFSSPEKVMNLNFLFINDGYVLGELGKEGQKFSDIQEYLTKGVRNWGNDYMVKICNTHEEFLRALKSIKLPQGEEDGNQDEKEKVIAHLLSLIV